MVHHIIHKQEVLLDVHDMNNAFNYQQTISDLFANGLTQAIEETFNTIDKPGTVTRINKLNLDLGEINPSRFNEDFKEKFIQQLKVSLESLNQETNSEVVTVKQSRSLRESFIYFIERGIFPWHIEMKNMPAFEVSVFDEWTKNDWLFIVEWLQKNSKNNYIYTERLVQQFSIIFLKKIVATSTAQNIDDDEWQLLLNDLKLIYSKINVSSISTSFPLTQNNYLIMLLQKTLLNNNIIKLDEIVAAQLRDLFLIIDEKKHSVNKEDLQKEPGNDFINKNDSFSAGRENDFAAKLKALLSSISTSTVIKILKNIFLVKRKKINLRHIDVKDLLQAEEYIISKYDSTVDETAITEIKEIEEKQSKQTKLKEAGDEDILFVDNCGIVLLHPFLQAYFEGLLLTENKKFISEDAQKRAILLLHYLSTGETEVAEFNLVLQKILCGLDIDETLPSVIILLQDEIEESRKLLQSVIDYWPPLKNTSTEGLQSAFLQRKGKLANTDAGWQLTVEQKTVDILIGKLPWGFSTIKLPWMQGLLNVEWC